MNLNFYFSRLRKSAFAVGLFSVFLPLTASAQDSCASALPITAGTTTVDAINGLNIPSVCSNASMAEWYAYTPDANYMVTVTSDLPENACKDTHLNIYTGECGSLACVAEDDDSGLVACPNNGTSYLSVETFEVFAGQTYYIVWDNRWSASGFQFQLIEMPLDGPCATATPVMAGTTTVDAITGGNITSPCSDASSANWYVYVPLSNMSVTVTSDVPGNECKNTALSIYNGSCFGTLTCIAGDDDSGELECPEGGESLLAKKSFNVTAGVPYYIVWDNRWSAEGFDFQIIEQPVVYPVTYSPQTIATINNSYNSCVVDMNNDGLDDVVGISTGVMKVHFQGDGGTLTPQSFFVDGPSKMPSWSIAAGDFNKDGYNDIMMGSGDGLSLWYSNANGTAYTNVTPGDYIFCQRTNFVDINNDGHLDLFSCHDVDPNVYYINDGDGGMTYYQSGITPGSYNIGTLMSGGNYASLWTDFDNDGDVDLFISKCSGPPCELHRNDGEAGYTDVSAIAQINFTPVQSWSSAIADFDNDGDMDIIVGTNAGTPTRVYRNNFETTGTLSAFTNITAGSGWEANNSPNRDYIAYDFDNDGFVDVLGGGNKIMFNNGDLTFTPWTYPGLQVGAIGDLNNDGFLDFLNGNTIRYGVPNGNNWVKVKLNGIQSNGNGIGARVEIQGAWGKQIRDIRSGEGFEYMSTLNAHFGLGQADAIDTMIIRWPSGIVDTLINPSINQLHMVTEGSTLAVGEAAAGQFKVYPNPADDIVNIALQDASETLKSTRIFDLNGRMISKPSIDGSTVNVKSLSTGTYLMLLETTSGKMQTLKFVKK